MSDLLKNGLSADKTIVDGNSLTWEQTVAKVGLSATYANANTAMTYARGTFSSKERVSALAFSEEMDAKIEKIKSGDLSEFESTLAAQAVTLDAIFNELAKRAIDNISHLGNFEILLKMALKSQAQSRLNIETLAEIKYPKSATFVKQQNVAYQQQVNNGKARVQGKNINPVSRGKRKSNLSNEVLELGNGERLDRGAQITSISVDSRMETMGAINGCENRARKEGK